jgi:membrane associated rhomboid family serine protease
MIPIRDMNPTRRLPVITVTFIAINVIMFLYQAMTWVSGGVEPMVYEMGLVPYAVTHAFSPAVALTFLTAMFMHGGLMHIAGNMLYLWIFGNNVEDAMGRLRFVVFYLVCGIAASAAQILAAPNSRVPTIGASGAIAGILGGYIVLYPKARVQTLLILGYFIRITELPAIIVLGGWFVLQLLNGAASFGVAQSGGVAWFAHIGGFLAGVVLVRITLMSAYPST